MFFNLLVEIFVYGSMAIIAAACWSQLFNGWTPSDNDD